MSNRSAFQRGVGPVLQVLLSGREEAVLSIAPDAALRQRIEVLATRSNEGELTAEEREEYTGYVLANKFVAILRREARATQAGVAA